jgi:hypothetical protein
LGRPGSGCPAGWCPPVRRPAGWCPPVCPVTSVSSAEARRWPWGSHRCGGQPSRRGRIELPVVWGVPSGSVDGPSRPGGATRRRSCGGGRGSVGRGPGRVVLGRRLRPRSTADRPGASPAGGSPVAAGYPEAWERGLKCEVPAPTGGGELGLDPRLRSVVVVEPDDRVDGLEGSTSSTVRMRRGPSAAQPGSERARLGADDAVTCENGGGRDRV